MRMQVSTTQNDDDDVNDLNLCLTQDPYQLSQQFLSRLGLISPQLESELEPIGRVVSSATFSNNHEY